MNTIVVGYDDTDPAKRKSACRRARGPLRRQGDRHERLALILISGRGVGPIDPSSIPRSTEELMNAAAFLTEHGVEGEFDVALDEPASHIVHLAEQRGVIRSSSVPPSRASSSACWAQRQRARSRQAHCDVMVVHRTMPDPRLPSEMRDNHPMHVLIVGGGVAALEAPLRSAPSRRGAGAGRAARVRASTPQVPSACVASLSARARSVRSISRSAPPGGATLRMATSSRSTPSVGSRIWAPAVLMPVLHSAPRLWRRTTRCSRRCADVPRLSGYREGFERLLREIESGDVGRVAFAVPPGPSGAFRSTSSRP